MQYDWLLASKCPSVYPSACLWDCDAVVKRYILQQTCLNKWIENAVLGTWQYNFQPRTPIMSLQTPHIHNFQCNAIGCLSNSCASCIHFRTFSVYIQLPYCREALGLESRPVRSIAIRLPVRLAALAVDQGNDDALLVFQRNFSWTQQLRTTRRNDDDNDNGTDDK